MMRIGVRAHDFGKLPAEELAARISARGLSCVQLALSKAIAGIDLKPGELNPGMAFHIGQAFHRHGLQIAVLGCYINPIHPDPEKFSPPERGLAGSVHPGGGWNFGGLRGFFRTAG